MARMEYTQELAGDQPATLARKAARGARWYRSSFGRALEILDVAVILLVMTYVLKVTTADHVLTAALSACLPMAIGGIGLWWILREHDLYRFDAEPSAVTHGIKTLGAVVLALPTTAGIGALVALAAGRAAEAGAWEAGIATLLAGCIIVSVHFFSALILGAMIKAGLFSLNVVIVGATPLAHKLIEEAKASGDIAVLGVFDDRMDRTGFEGWLERSAGSSDPLFWAVVDKRTGRAEGRQALMRIDAGHGVIEIGSILWGPAMAGTRVATEAQFLFACHVFDDLGYRRFEWKCDDRNQASKRAALRFGFRFEGIFRQHMVVKGQNRDTAWFSIIDHDWPALKARYLAWLDPANFDGEGRQRQRLQDIDPA